jgi:hypothetical protein
MRPINRIVICEPLQEEKSIIIYSDNGNKKCRVLYSDPKNFVKPDDLIVIDTAVITYYDSDNNLYYLHDLAIKAVIK